MATRRQADGPAAPAPHPALNLAARIATLAEAVEAGAAIVFDSQPQARAWQGRVDAAIAVAATDAAALAATLPLGAGPLWRQATALRRSFAADMAVRIGELPDSGMTATRVGQVRRAVCASSVAKLAATSCSGRRCVLSARSGTRPARIAASTALMGSIGARVSDRS